ncbi:MAG: hypothetical protein ACT4OK_10370 [Gemmobacter sp.]
MTGLRDGIFAHQEGSTPRHVVERLLDGRVNLRLDNPFAMTFEELKERIAKAKKQKFDAEHRVLLLAGEIDRLETQQRDLVEAQQRFVETGEIDPALIPECDHVVAEQASGRNAVACKAARAVIEDKVKAEGWQVERTHADDRYVYVTIKRAREEFDTVEEPQKERIVARVIEAIESRKDAFRQFLAPMRRIATAPVNPAAP